MYDQPYETMQNMSTLLNVYSTVSHLRSLQGNAIHRLTDSQRRLIRWLLDNEIQVL